MWEEWDSRLILSFNESTHGEGFDDRELEALFYSGWVDTENTPDERYAIRQEFFDRMDELGYDGYSDFDWDDWRDWYEDAG